MAYEAKRAEQKEAGGDLPPAMISRPSYAQMFKPRPVAELMQEVMAERLDGKAYDRNEATAWTKEISTAIKERLKGLGLPRYKMMVQVVLGELGGAGVQMGARCLWDAQSDKVASATYRNDALFCTATAFGVYLN